MLSSYGHKNKVLNDKKRRNVIRHLASCVIKACSKRAVAIPALTEKGIE